jgi:hypothetical protein
MVGAGVIDPGANSDTIPGPDSAGFTASGDSRFTTGVGNATIIGSAEALPRP